MACVVRLVHCNHSCAQSKFHDNKNKYTFWFSSEAVSSYLFIFTLALHSSTTVLLHCGNACFRIHRQREREWDHVNKQTNKQTSNAHLGKYHKLHSTYAIHYAHIHSLDVETFLLANVEMCTQKYSNVCQENETKPNETKKKDINIVSGRFHLCLLSWKDRFSKNACREK